MWNPLTTQIEPHDWQAELYSKVSHTNRVLHNLCTDLWAYISMGYFTPDPAGRHHRLVDHAAQDQPDPLRERRGQPRAVQSRILELLAQTLVTSRLQRDLTDSTTQRNVGVGFGHSLLAMDNILRGLAESRGQRGEAGCRSRRELGSAR